jgi:hypothetical protein
VRLSLSERIARAVEGAFQARPAAYRFLPPKHSIALTFEYVPRRAIAPPDEPSQSPRLDTVAALFSDIEELYWLAVPPDARRPAPEERSLDDRWTPRLTAAHFGSPFHILVEMPPYVWAGAATGFVGALSAVFGAPYKAAARFHSARADYWRSRIDADQSKRAWIEARQQAHAEDGFRLVDAKLPRASGRDE